MKVKCKLQIIYWYHLYGEKKMFWSFGVIVNIWWYSSAANDRNLFWNFEIWFGEKWDGIWNGLFVGGTVVVCVVVDFALVKGCVVFSWLTAWLVVKAAVVLMIWDLWLWYVGDISPFPSLSCLSCGPFSPSPSPLSPWLPKCGPSELVPWINSSNIRPGFINIFLVTKWKTETHIPH